MKMSIEPEHKIGHKVLYWVAKNPKDRVHGVVCDICGGWEHPEFDQDEDEDLRTIEENDWYIKVRLDDGTETDWSNEYYWRRENE